MKRKTAVVLLAVLLVGVGLGLSLTRLDGPRRYWQIETGMTGRQVDAMLSRDAGFIDVTWDLKTVKDHAHDWTWSGGWYGITIRIEFGPGERVVRKSIRYYLN